MQNIPEIIYAQFKFKPEIQQYIMCSFGILSLNQQNYLNFCTLVSAAIPLISYSQSCGSPRLSNGSFSKSKGFIVFQCHLSSFYDTDRLWFISIHGWAIHFFNSVCPSVLWAVLVPCSQREAFMSLCLAIPAFLVMFSYASHLCNLPVGNPVSW